MTTLEPHGFSPHLARLRFALVLHLIPEVAVVRAVATAAVARQVDPYLWIGSPSPRDPPVRQRSALALADLVQLSQASTAHYRDAGIHSLLHAVANLRQGTLSQLASLGLRAFSARPLP